MKTYLERFEEKVHVLSEVDNLCHIWIGSKTRGGYGQFQSRRAHRVAYELYIGEITGDLQVQHTCNQGHNACVNPDHLKLGTAKDNMEDKRRAGNHHNTKKTHCSNGHEFTKGNTYILRNGGRQCRKCTNIRVVAINRKKRGLR